MAMAGARDRRFGQAAQGRHPSHPWQCLSLIPWHPFRLTLLGTHGGMAESGRLPQVTGHSFQTRVFRKNLGLLGLIEVPFLPDPSDAQTMLDGGAQVGRRLLALV